MATRAPFRPKLPGAGHWVEIALAAGAAALVAAALAPSPADARLFGKRKPPVDFSVTRAPAVVPIAAPANGAIFQAADGYAALYEGTRARRSSAA